MELKCLSGFLHSNATSSLNRTFMELKWEAVLNKTRKNLFKSHLYGIEIYFTRVRAIYARV